MEFTPPQGTHVPGRTASTAWEPPTDNGHLWGDLGIQEQVRQPHQPPDGGSESPDRTAAFGLPAAGQDFGPAGGDEHAPRAGAKQQETPDEQQQAVEESPRGRQAHAPHAMELAIVGGFEPYSVGDPGRAASMVVPLPDTENWHRRDSVFDGFTLHLPQERPAAVVRAASIRGLAHRASGKPRQDEYAYQLSQDGRFLVLCVADGISSGARSHQAAEVAARTGVALVAKELTSTPPDSLDWDHLVREVAGHIVKFARTRLPGGEELTPEQVVSVMGTTATYAVLDLLSLEVDAVMVGDTSIWVLTRDQWVPLTAVKNADSDIATSAVEALPVVTARGRTPLRSRLRPGEALVLMSDGVGDPLGRGTGAVGRFLAGAWQNPPHEIDFAAQVAFSKRSFDDDRTVVAVWPVAPS
ncbi:protein phosphatase 2C domain-containing protein [Actinokineospora bangkokensis]|uniref:protein phosphatase 2C domain-containing protein n=1 Tax=Actinokineospora bangkokensis TaxID=1193682 RepID=UPI0013010ED4|nr:protein phosphatase 2C domain-containing protein [Actinokineospora bangkokensis]